MKLSTPRYTLCLFFQLMFLFLDLVFNCVSLFPRNRDSLLVLFIFQDLFLVLSITTMLMTLFSTYLFQVRSLMLAGLGEVLVRRFLGAGAAAAGYAALSVATHAAWLLDKWPDAQRPSSPGLVLLFTLHRCLSPWYYFMYKRAALRVSDPRFYEDIDWINRQLQTR